VTTAPSANGVQIRLEFGDNRLLPALFGEHDCHLARIEQHLGVTVVPRGNLVAIEGPADSADRAREALLRLYRHLEDGQAIDMGEVDGALRFAAVADRSPDTGDAAPAGPAAGLAEVTIETRKRRITARSPVQADYLRALAQHELVFALGPAGTGKTYLAVAKAVSLMMRGEIQRLILSRPAVEAGERLGFLPGDLREKVDPYLRPLYDALYDMLPAEQVARWLESGEIEIAPLAFMRGRTLANAFVILDEAQNTTPMQMKMFLTRLGEHSRMVVTGDMSQVDLPPGQRSGLADALEVSAGIAGVSVVRFGAEDVVRHGLVTELVKAYDARDRLLAAEKRGSDGNAGGGR
jgi:phosphate starvation-inducible PhoH-like protein